MKIVRPINISLLLESFKYVGRLTTITILQISIRKDYVINTIITNLKLRMHRSLINPGLNFMATVSSHVNRL